MKHLLAMVLGIVACGSGLGQAPTDLFDRGEGIDLDRAIPANERGILCLVAGERGRIFGGTTGRAAHLFVYDPATHKARSLARLEGGVGFAYGLVRLPDGSLIGGTQADPTGVAVKTDPRAVGHMYHFTLAGNGLARTVDLGVPVAGQGIYTLAHNPATGEVLGNTWPDGHFFTYDLKTRKFKDHGAIAGYRTFETPAHAEDLNRGTDEHIRYPRQVSRAIAVDPGTGAYTGGADGFLYRYDWRARKVEKLAVALPAARGREPWASLDATVIHARRDREAGEYMSLVGGTSDGYLFELRILGKQKLQMRPRGKPLAQGTIQGLVYAGPSSGQGGGQGRLTGEIFYGVGGNVEGMPRTFRFLRGGRSSAVVPGGIPQVDGQISMVGFGALIADGQGNLYAGERDRIAHLVRYRLRDETRKEPVKPAVPPALPKPEGDSPAKLDCRVVFAPQGTTTDGSGYTAIEVGTDGKVYVGAARYGGYAWLLRFDPAAHPVFMDKLVSMKQLTGEHRQGINTQGKIHAKIVVGADGRVWFASKQAHEIFDTRPEYGEDPNGFPGGHLCYYDPKTGFSRSMGILKKQEGLMGGVIDDERGKLYYRSEPKNNFLVYDLKTGDVRDCGHVGAVCRYMARDRAGAVYTPGRGTYLACYDPQTGYVEDLAIKVEGKGGYLAPYVIAMGPGGKLYGAAAGHPWLMEFDVDRIKRGAFPEVVVRSVAAAAPVGMPVQDIHAAVFGKDGRLYYPLNTHGPLTRGGKAEPHLRIMRFDPATKRVETVGVPNVVGLDEARVKHVYTRPAKYVLQYMQGAAVGPDGSLYLMAIYPQLNVACFPRLTARK
jgi:sugar lactone lactonase YvrE